MPILVPDPDALAASRRTWLRHIADQRAFDIELSKILRDAAKDAERRIKSILGDSVSAQVRRAQLSLAVSQLTQLSNEMWGSRIGPALTAAQAKAINLGVDGVIKLDEILAKALADPALRQSFIESAQRAANNVRSRLLNNIQLSDQVYKTKALADKWVDRAINRGIAQNLSAAEIARSVRHMIDPNVKGGVSYASRRLARTELNNAFHTTTIRATADEPWTTGYKWNLSGSHPRPDPCDDFATEDHDGLGAGVFSPKSVPGKPHPQCLCYLTVISVDDEEFIDNLVTGQYNTYLGDDSLGSSLTSPLPPTPSVIGSASNASQVAKSLNAGKAAKVPEDLSAGVRRWTSGTDDEFISQIAGSYNGIAPTRPDVRALLDTVDAAPITDTMLHRGFRLRDDRARTFASSLTEGSVVDFPVTSWTSERVIADGFAGVPRYAYQMPTNSSLVIEMRSSQALRIDRIKTNVHLDQKEWIVQGPSRVVSRTVDPDGTIRVVMERA